MLSIYNDTMKHFLQKQPRNLTMAKHSLGIHQMRVMARAVEALQPFMCFNVDHTKEVEDVKIKVKVSELVVGNNVKPLREALKNLMKKDVIIMHYDPEKANYVEIGVPIIQLYRYQHGTEFVELQISGHLLPQIIDLARGYTKYSIDVAFNTSSPNIFKIYQYISHFKDKKQIHCNVSTFRKWLQIEDKYAMPAKIKERILNPAMRELKEKADVWFDIAERIKDGRRMIGWKFNIYTKQPPKKPSKALHEATQTAPPTNGPKPPNLEHLENKLMLNGAQAKQIVAFFNKATPAKQKKMKTIFQEIEWAIRDKKIHTSIGGYVTKTINKTFKGDLKI